MSAELEIRDGLGYDPAAHDGIYAGSLNLELACRLLLKYQQNVHGHGASMSSPKTST